MNEASQREHNACNPADAATSHGDCWGAGGGRCKKQPSTPSATPYGEHGIKDINNQETGFVPPSHPNSWGAYESNVSVSPEVCIFPYTKEH